MKIAIIGAMEKETKDLIELIEEKKEVVKGPFVFYCGRFSNHDIIVTTSGIGKTSSGLIIGILVSNFSNIDLIINMGVSGGIKGEVKPGDIVISKELSYADVDVTVDGYEYGQIPKMPRLFKSEIEKFFKLKNLSIPYHYGMILTGDSFFCDEKKVLEITNKFPNNVMAMDMESTAFAQCSFIYNIPFVAIRAISDVIGGSEQMDNYYNYVLEATTKAFEAVVSILKGIE